MIGSMKTTLTTLRTLENKDGKQSLYLEHGDKKGVKALAALRFNIIAGYNKHLHNQDLSPFCNFKECAPHLHLQTTEHLLVECQHFNDPRDYYIQQLERYQVKPDLNTMLGDLTKIQQQDRAEALDIIIKFANIVTNEIKQQEVPQET